MPIKFTCVCGKILEASERSAGKKAKCPYCKEMIGIPSSASDEMQAAGIPRKMVDETQSLKVIKETQNDSGEFTFSPTPSAQAQTPKMPAKHSRLPTATGIKENLETSTVGRKCPKCGKNYIQSRVVCTDCGINIVTGEVLDGVDCDDDASSKGISSKKKLVLAIIFINLLLATIIFLALFFFVLKKDETKAESNEPDVELLD